MTGPWKPYTRGEDLALVSMRVLSDSSVREIARAIGRSYQSVSSRMASLGVRLPGGRAWAMRFLAAKEGAM